MSKQVAILVAILAFVLGGWYVCLINNSNYLELKHDILLEVASTYDLVSEEKDRSNFYDQNWWYYEGQQVILTEVRDNLISIFSNYENKNGILFKRLAHGKKREDEWVHSYLLFWQLYPQVRDSLLKEE